jgi:hypothetical protein
MPTVVKTIGSAARDFTVPGTVSTGWVQSWPANLTAGGSNEIYEGDNFNDTEFTAAGWVIDTSGVTTVTDSTHYFALTTGAGQSFRDQAGVRTNALRYNAANGAAYRNTGTAATGAAQFKAVINMQVSNLQFAADTGASKSALIGAASAETYIFNNCIFSGMEVEIDNGTMTFNNCLFVNTLGPFGSRGFVLTGGTSTFNACGFIVLNGATSYVFNSATANYNNCYFFGSGAATFNATTPVADNFSHCMTDITGATGLTGGKTFANQFVSTTNDFRVKAGADLIGAGAPIGGITTDISGFTRNASTPTIGPWEVAPAAGPGGGGVSWLYFGQMLAGMGLGDALLSGLGLKFGADLIRNPMRSRRRLLLGDSR